MSIKVGIVGYTGMVGQELINNIEPLDFADIVFLKNSSGAQGDPSNADVIFLATKDKESLSFASDYISAGRRVIDMSGAFRLDKASFEKWYGIEHTAPALLDRAVYGLPAVYSDQIATAVLVANPGCYATSVIIPLRAISKYIDGEATIVATSGNSGARREVEAEANDVRYSYGRKHKHVPEMERYSGTRVNFTPIVLRSVFRGINTNIRVRLSSSLLSLSDAAAAETLENAIKNTYSPEDLVFVVRDDADRSYGTSFVNNTNKIAIKLNVEDGFAYINSCIDNLGKGAATQAIENMCIMFGYPRSFN